MRYAPIVRGWNKAWNARFEGSLSIAAGDGAAWVVDGFEGKLIRIDAKTNDVTTVPLGANQPHDVAIAVSDV